MQLVDENTGARAVNLARAMQASCLGARVGRLQRLVGRAYEQALRPWGLTVPQTEVLSALVLIDQPVRPAELASLLGIERSTMSRNLALMEQRGYLAPTETSPTGRSQRIAISAEGVAVLAAADAAWQDAQQAVSELLGRDAVATLDTWLGALSVSDAASDAVD